MKKFYNDPQAELIELDALITTLDVSGDGGEVDPTKAEEDVTGLFD